MLYHDHLTQYIRATYSWFLLVISMFALTVSITAAQAKCTTQDYIAYGRAGMSNAQIAEKCNAPKTVQTNKNAGNTQIPVWLAGQWAVTLKLEQYFVHDLKAAQDAHFNPFLQGMKAFTDLADKPDERREELWLTAIGKDPVTHKNLLTLTRIYSPEYNPGSAPFDHLAGKQNSGHQLVRSAIINNHLKAEVVSPPYRNEGIEQWSFDIDLAGNGGQTSQLVGHYRVTRKNLLEGKIYSHSGLIILNKM